jgi:uncharacterized protein
MRILIAGGSGFLGQTLTRRLAADGHRVQILTRQAVRPGTNDPASLVERITWNPDGDPGPWAPACRGTDVIVNLAGASLAAGRWTLPRKAQLIASRLQPTRTLAAFVAQSDHKPALFLSSSAIGFYGDRGDDVVTEAAPVGTDFLAELCATWEHQAVMARKCGTRVVPLRTGLVLDPAEGALAKMLLPFRLGAGGRFGSGRQYMSWIHRDDWVSLVRWAAREPGLDGPLNATAPCPATNAEFARALGRALHRPAVLPAPAFALRLLLGEMAQALLLSGQRVTPHRALHLGFRFEYERLDDALADLIGRRPPSGAG